MKVIQINCVYNTGSTGKITYDLHNELDKKGIQNLVYYGRGVKSNDQHTLKICTELYSYINHLYCNVTGLMYGSCYASTKKLQRLIKKEKPDVVHLQCINGYFVNIYKLIKWLNRHNIRTVMTFHAEFMFTANCGYAIECKKWKTGCGHCEQYKAITSSYIFDRTATSWKKMRDAFEGFEHLTIVSVSPWLMNRAKLSPFLNNYDHQVVLNGIDTDVFKPYDTTTLKQELAPKNEKILLYVTSYFTSDKNHIKGGYYIIELAKKLQYEHVKIIVAGDYDSNAIVPDNIQFIGKISDQKQLAQMYSMADITVLTSRRETYSMVTVESLCCGTPVVGFQAGAPEQIALQQWTQFVPYADVDALVKGIHDTWNQNMNSDCIRKDAMKKYSKEKMCENYLNIYKELCENK